MAQAAVQERPRRSGPHAERTAQMRERLNEAAVACLCRVGYAATTVQLVTDEANVSRGAMLHHFPAKVDLMTSVAAYCAEKQNRYVNWRLGQIAPGVDRFLAITDATWEVMAKPHALAFLEIMMGSRSDPALGERFSAVIEDLESGQEEGVWRMAEAIGIADRQRVLDMVRLHRAAMRGLLLEAVLKGERAPAERAMALLDHYKKTLTGEMMADRPPLPPVPPRR